MNLPPVPNHPRVQIHLFVLNHLLARNRLRVPIHQLAWSRLVVQTPLLVQIHLQMIHVAAIKINNNSVFDIQLQSCSMFDSKPVIYLLKICCFLNPSSFLRWCNRLSPKFRAKAHHHPPERSETLIL